MAAWKRRRTGGEPVPAAPGSGFQAGRLVAWPASVARAGALDASDILVGKGAVRRRFSVYEPLAAFDLVDELEFLTARSIEPVPFYAPQFLVPAMPRLDDRQLRLLVARDEEARRSRLRLLMPFSVERTGILGGPSCLRAWTHPFGPRGTIEIDHDDPAGTVATLLDVLREPALDLPPLLVLPDLKLDGPVAGALIAEARRRGLPFRVIERRSRACLDATADPQAFLSGALSPRRRRELARQRRRLEASGEVSFTVARDPAAIRPAVEEFLALEASGWKGRARSALLVDRYRAAFAREALDALAGHDRVRIHSLTLDGRAVASAVVLLAQGQAVLWKMAYDEAHAASSPGFLLMAEASVALLRDPAVAFVDSCAVPDHSLINRLWRERMEVGTLVLGLEEGAGRRVSRAAGALDRSRLLRQSVWRVRSASRALFRRIVRA